MNSDEWEMDESPKPRKLTLEEAHAKAKAEFCLNLGIAPSEYDGLTTTEVHAFMKEQERINRKAKKGR